MKKIILSSLLVAMFFITGKAQSDLLIRAGIHSVLSSESEINSANIKGGRVGWNAGLDYRVGNHLFFQPGLHYYSSSLSLSTDNGNVDDFKNSARLQSLKVPLMVGLSPFNLERSDFAIVVNGGIVPTFNLGIVDDNDFIKDDDITNVNWSGKVGAGLEIGAFILGVDYEFGLNKLFEDADANFSIIGATVGLKF
ncbi:outer membrane beta-barrel protein [Membranihabitans maritimus]|uniref:outer membrane beta-barrel protein n=1 Tax=Membranihabitans maritimus TaxID=2904244 RepID=UPI001F27C7B1|nr:outer membrane beta-barrel protein [Membranihabitans maritimus]